MWNYVREGNLNAHNTHSATVIVIDDAVAVGRNLAIPCHMPLEHKKRKHQEATLKAREA